MGISVNGIPILGIPGIGVPPGGIENQVLAKKSDANYDTEWVDQTGVADITVATEEKIGGILSSSNKGELSVSESGISTINDNVTMEQSAEIVSLESGLGEGPYKLLFDFDEEKIPDDLEQMRQDIDKNTVDIQSNADNIEKNTTNISNNTSEIKANSSNIEVIQNRLVYYSNPNLLDNWYFINPINQLGNTSHTGSGMVIDRWRSYTDWLKTELTSDGIVLQSTSSTDLATIAYYAPLSEFIKNVPYTISMLLSNNELLSCTVSTIGVYNGTGYNKTGLVGIETYTSNNVNLAVRIFVKANSTSPAVRAVKLELGNQQTLAHQDSSGNWILNDSIPIYQTQLLKCQRYMQVIGNTSGYSEIGEGFSYVSGSNTQISMEVPLNTTLRITPSIYINNALRFIRRSTSGNNAVSVYNLNKSSILSTSSSEGRQNLCNIGLITSQTDFPPAFPYFQVDNSNNVNNYIILDANL